MKIPKTFTPEKNLDKKIEELKSEKEKAALKPVSLEDLMYNNMEVFYCRINGIFDFYQRRESKNGLNQQAFESILEDTFSGRIKWKMKNDRSYVSFRKEGKEKKIRLKTYTANATVTNAEGESIIIPVMFRTDVHYSGIWGYLHLGDERGPCRNTYNKNVNRLAKEYFKVKVHEK